MPSKFNSTLLLAGALALPLFAQDPSPDLSPAPAEPLTLWYRRPAAQWVEALPLGNGRLGAMVFGGIEQERIQINEETLWAGGPYDPNNPEARAALPAARAGFGTAMPCMICACSRANR